jgi:hypothetical protein
LSEDSLRFAAGDPNLYRYVGNSPTNRTDPSGLEVQYRKTVSGGLEVLDRDGTFIGGLVDIDGVTYVRKGGLIVALELVIQAESSWTWRPSGLDSASRQEAWRKWFGKYGTDANPKPNPEATIINGCGPLNDHLNNVSKKGTTSPPQIGTFEGKPYQVAGPLAAMLIIGMARTVGVTVAEESLLTFGGGRAAEFLGHIVGKGWRVLRGKDGSVIKVLKENGEAVSKDELLKAADDFKKKPATSPKPAAPRVRVPDPNWKSTWQDPALVGRQKAATKNATTLGDNLGLGPIKTDGREAHHIIASTDMRTPAWGESRKLLMDHQVCINSPANGVALQSTKPGARLNPGLRNHHGESLHSKETGIEINRRLQEAAKRGGNDWGKRQDEILKELDRLRTSAKTYATNKRHGPRC